MSKTKIKYKNPEIAYIKAVKRVMREEVGFIPTKIKTSKKAYKRTKKTIDKNNINFDD